MARSSAPSFVRLLIVSLAVMAGCAVPNQSEEEGESTSRVVSMSVSDVMKRAQEWVDKKVPYCGGPRGGADVLCGGTCNRPPAAWDKYRSDCSGFVSWTWQIPDVPSTYGFMDDRAGDNGWHSVDLDDLKQGDALVCQTHMKLYNGDAGNTGYEIYEESDCGLVAQKRTQTVTRINGRTFRINGDDRVYHAIRRNGITGGGATDGAAGGGEGSQVFATEAQQHFFGRSASGDLQHAYWDAADNKIHKDVWGNGIDGAPATFVYGVQQHAFARSTAGALEHWFWDAPEMKVKHDTWGQGLMSDPAVALMGGGQHAWAVDTAGKLQHWYWVEGAGVKADTWGEGLAPTGRPSVLESAEEQHVFGQGTNGSLEHFWWAKDGLHHDTWAAAGTIASEPVARLINGDQHVWAVDAAGALQHWWWSASKNAITHDTWTTSGLDPAGRPAVMVHGLGQHVFSRGPTGQVEHYFWSPEKGVSHDTWGQGIAGDPSTMLVGDDEHVFAQAADGSIQHWWWTQAKGISHDTW